MSSAYDRLPLNALRVFEAVATRLSFGEAAEVLHVTPAAVSQQIKSLEDYLQTPLFRRNGRQVQLTPEGARLLPGIRRGLDELEAALHDLKQDREGGKLNVSTLSSFLQKWLTPRIAELHTAHPELELHIQGAAELIDFTRTDFHAAIRFGTGVYEGLHCEKLLNEWLVAVAAPSVLAEHGPLPADGGGLSRLPLLHGTEIDWADWCAGDTQCLRNLRGAVIDDSVSLLTAVVEGIGYGIVRWTLAAGELQSGRIALASGRAVPHEFAYYFVCPVSYRALPKLVTFREWLVQQASGFGGPPRAVAPSGTRPAAASRA